MMKKLSYWVAYALFSLIAFNACQNSDSDISSPAKQEALPSYYKPSTKELTDEEKPSNTNDSTIVIGKKLSIYSDILDEEREIYIHVPQSSHNSDIAYPVLYLFDGQYHFNLMVGMMAQLSTSSGDEICPEMIVVGIPHSDRMKDLGFGADMEAKLSQKDIKEDPFTAFIAKELQPYIETHYKTMPYKTLFGYSLGGLKAMHILAHQPDLFDAYVAIDPSLSMYYNQWFDASYDKLIQNNLSHKSVYIAMAQTMPMGTDTSEIKKDTTTDSRHMRNIMKTAEALEQNKTLSQFDWKFYPKEYHGSLPLIAKYDAFNSIYDWYNLQHIRFIFKEENPQKVKQAIEAHFQKASDISGITFEPTELYLFKLLNYFKYKKQKGKAKVIAELIIKYHPESPHVAYLQNLIDKK